VKYANHRLTWGKHRGRTLAEIGAAGDRDYIAWMSGGAWSPGEREIARVYLEDAEDRLPALAILPEPILASKNLSPGAKCLFAVVYTSALHDPNRHCRLSNAGLARSAGLSTKQVQRLLDALEGLGLIVRELPDPGHRASILVVEPEGGWDKLSKPAETFCTPTDHYEDHFEAIRNENLRTPIRGKIRTPQP
jgi:hypothetical protein